MASNYTGVPTATEAPSAAPGPGVAPIVSLPRDGDPDNGATFEQAYKVLADFAAYSTKGMITLYVGSGLASLPAPFFSTVAAAVTYAGTATQKAQIVLVGNTTETATPIVMPSDGIQIVGGRKSHTISWAGAHTLFDLNGKANLVFRDFTMNFTGASSAGVNLNMAFANLAVGQVDRLLIENCDLLGANAQGFLYDSNTGAGGFIKCKVRGCFSEAKNFGIYCSVNVSYCTEMVIENNHFISATGSDVANMASILLGGATGGGHVIKGNTLGGSDASYLAIYLDANQYFSHVSANVVPTTVHGTFHSLTNNNTVRDNDFENILLEGANDVVSGNTVGTNLTVASWAVVTNNFLNTPVDVWTGNGNLTATGSNVVFSGNVLLGGNIVIPSGATGKDCIITNNNVSGSIGTAAAGAAPTPTITVGNIVGTTIFTVFIPVSTQTGMNSGA